MFRSNIVALARQSLPSLNRATLPYAMKAALNVLQQRKYAEWSTSVSHLRDWTSSQALVSWILDQIKVMQPSRVRLCDGSEEENQELLTKMVHAGSLIKLSKEYRPNSYLARSRKDDVARVEESTYICSENEGDAGPTNNWKNPEEMRKILSKHFEGSMQGRTMYVVPFCMGPLGSPFSKIGVQLTDSPYVVVNMRIMARMGKAVLEQLGDKGDFVPCVHSVGVPLARAEEDTTWPCNPNTKLIVHFPEDREIFSYGSGYGGNALLGKKCLALRIASVMARDEGWLAEHMLIVGITNPKGEKKYFVAAFPSACGKTNLAMLLPRVPGWKVECAGDDIAWLRVGPDGRLYAVNPESGCFGVAPGTSMDSNPNAMKMLEKDTIFTNVAITPQGDVWWEGMTKEAPNQLMSWLRTDRFPDSGFEAAHPNARFTTSIKSCPILDPDWEKPEGLPISGIIFGGRRSSTMPLVYQSRDWNHGTFVGSVMNSETTAAAGGKRGVLRPDPMAMKPFCGYNMADYFNHWLSMSEKTEQTKLPKIFHVNWFRKNANGKFMWPGYGDNIRVLEWIFNRCDEPQQESKIGVETPIGFVPAADAINVKDLPVTAETMKELFRIEKNEWLGEVQRARAFYKTFGDHLPAEMTNQLNALEERIKAIPEEEKHAVAST